MLYGDINYVAVLVAGISAMFVGWIWYSMPVFGRTWMKLIGKTEAELKNGAGKAMALAFVLALLEAYVLAHFVDYAGAISLMDGIVTGFWVWLGFAGITITVNNLFEGRPAKLTWIQVGYHLVTLAIMGAILAVWA